MHRISLCVDCGIERKKIKNGTAFSEHLKAHGSENSRYEINKKFNT